VTFDGDERAGIFGLKQRTAAPTRPASQREVKREGEISFFMISVPFWVTYILNSLLLNFYRISGGLREYVEK
jgi:hypothetical protein